MRNTLAYFDVTILSSPITLHVPTDEKLEIPHFMQMDGLNYHWHITFGPPPSFNPFKNESTFYVSSISSQLSASQLSLLEKSISIIKCQV